jgi:uncharacterized protein
MPARLIDASLFSDDSPPCLMGGRDRHTGRIVFPQPKEAGLFEPVRLPREGRLWSYTVQRFAPKSPPYAGSVPFEPFALGYVELEGCTIVESRLTGIAFEELRLGMRMRLTTVLLRSDPDGTSILTYAFEPAAGEAA